MITGLITAAVEISKDDLFQAAIIIMGAIVVIIERIILRNPKIRSLNKWWDLIARKKKEFEIGQFDHKIIEKPKPTAGRSEPKDQPIDQQ